MTSILTNISAMAALQTLRMIGSNMADTQREVSSGLRVQTAADNAAYWSISTTMRSDNVALAAVSDALGLGAAKVDVAYASMESTIDVLGEFRAKLVAAKEDGVDRAKIQTELDQFKGQFVSIATSASFNGVNWLNTDALENLWGLSSLPTSITSSFIRSSDGSVWVGTDSGELWRLDPESAEAIRMPGVSVNATDLTVDGTTLWIADGPGERVVSLDGETGETSSSSRPSSARWSPRPVEST